MSKAKDKGTAFETAAAKHLSEAFSVEVRRNPLMASLDQGDLFGVFVAGKHFCIECKNEKEYKLAEWMGELEREMPYADTDVGCVIFKRKGVGLDRFGKQFVLMDVDGLVNLLKGKLVDPVISPYYENRSAILNGIIEAQRQDLRYYREQVNRMSEDIDLLQDVIRELKKEEASG